MSEHFDVVVVGGGPGGSTVAALVARAGHRVLLLDKESFPRYQIGESLLPATVHGICRLLGVERELAEAGFPVKHGATFRWGANPRPWSFSFAESPRLAGQPAHAYQVERLKFDQILLDNARRTGVEVREQHTVLGVLEDDERVTGVRFRTPDGTIAAVEATVVVDASGAGSRIARHVGPRTRSEFLRNLAVFGYFEGGRRLPGPDAGNILSAAFDNGWLWYIPLSDTLTSVGAVVRPHLAPLVQADPEQALYGLIEQCPLIEDNLADATRVTEGPYGQVRVRKDWSYGSTRFWRPGMVLIGDAACSVDPVFCSGVHLATYSGLLAARSVNSVLSGAVPEDLAFAEFEGRYRREHGVFYDFLLSFYTLNVSKRSYFWTAKKVTECADSEFQSFVNLVGGVSSGEPDLIGAATEARTPVRTDAGRGTGLGTSLLADVPPRAPVARTAVRAGGLVAAPDGLSWLPPDQP
jgi:halogenation protein CepH